jgi:hypothetical protein
MTRHAPLWLQASEYAATLDRRLIGALWPGPRSEGCAVAAGGGMDVTIQPGSIAVPTANATGSTLCFSDAVETVTLDAALPAGSDRRDLIVCHAYGGDLDGGPAGCVKLAEVLVSGGSAAVEAAKVYDRRPGSLAVQNRLAFPLGFVARYTGPTNQTDYGGEGWTLRIMVVVPARRRYKFHSYCRGYAYNGSGNMSFQFYPQGSTFPWGMQMVVDNDTTPNMWNAGSCVWTYNNDTDGDVTLTIGTSAAGSGSWARVPANSAEIYVEDVGPSRAVIAALMSPPEPPDGVWPPDGEPQEADLALVGTGPEPVWGVGMGTDLHS